MAYRIFGLGCFVLYVYQRFCQRPCCQRQRCQRPCCQRPAAAARCGASRAAGQRRFPPAMGFQVREGQCSTKFLQHGLLFIAR